MTDSSLNNSNLTLEVVSEPSTGKPPEQPLRLLQRVLRGRYSLVIPLAAVLAVAGGFIGYYAVPPQYKSTGLVRVEGALPSILYDSPENHAPPMFDAYVASLATELSSRRIADAAVNSSEMAAAGWSTGPHGAAELQRSLAVRRGRGEQVIHVSITHANPQKAQTAVNAVLNSFENLCTDPGGLSFATKKETLVQRQQNLEQELHRLREQILEASDQYGIVAHTGMHRNVVEELMAIDDKLSEIRLARARLQSGEGGGANPKDALPLNRDSTTLTSLGEQELALVAEITSLRTKYGAQHPLIRELNRQLEAVRIQKELRGNALADLSIPPVMSGTDKTAVAVTPLDRLDEMESRYQEMRRQIRTEAERLGRAGVILANLDEQVQERKERLSETRRRLDELQVEASREQTNRVSIAAFGDLPAAPIVDRRSGVSAAGALFGAFLGTGMVLLIGLRDSRIRFVDEIESVDSSIHIAGILPDLNAGGEDCETRAARSVHQLRNLLELQCRHPNHNIHAVTSCDRGEGKTSLVLALGASFAAAGRKALVIDADITAAGLTRELDLAHAPGLCEAVGPRDGSAKVHQTRQPNLWAMPIGTTKDLDPEDLSRSKLVWILDTLRNKFDAIIIDTGPILSSVEACLVSAVADRVLTVVDRYQKLGLVQSSLARLEQVGAEPTGIVFNKAASADFKGRSYSQIDSASRVAAFIPPARRASEASSAPLAHAVKTQAEAQDHAVSERKRAA